MPAGRESKSQDNTNKNKSNNNNSGNYNYRTSESRYLKYNFLIGLPKGLNVKINVKISSIEYHVYGIC